VELAARFPVHVTARVRAALPSLRGQLEQTVLFGAFRAGCERFGFRLVHFAVLGNHMHYVVEAGGRRSLTAGLRGLHVRVARRLNRLWDRRGNVFPDRFHERILRSPREVRAVLAYVLHNARKHGVRQRDGEPDRCSSGRWFEGWRERRPDPWPGIRAVARARTWLLSVGWRRFGLLELRV
jgi:REP element-mobilizing transposase RayT